MGNVQGSEGAVGGDDEFQALDTLSLGELQQLATTLGVQPSSNMSSKDVLIGSIVNSKKERVHAHITQPLGSSPQSMQIKRGKSIEIAPKRPGLRKPPMAGPPMAKQTRRKEVSVGDRGRLLFKHSMSSDDEFISESRPSFQQW
jgi:hypothetical protein